MAPDLASQRHSESFPSVNSRPNVILPGREGRREGLPPGRGTRGSLIPTRPVPPSPSPLGAGPYSWSRSGPGRGGGAGSSRVPRGVPGPAVCAPGSLLHHASPTQAMAAADGSLLDNPRTFSRRPPAQASRQAKATKRKYQASSDAPPAKRRNETSFLPAKKTSVKETQRTFKGNTQKTFSPKKHSVSTSDRNQEERQCIKTSSLFKNNPDIPELHRPVVKQVQEKVFTSAAFHELGLHPHLISTINTVLKMSSMTSVQKQSIPVLLEGRDALVRSQTGSGKTLAYCIPVVQSLQAMESKIQRSDGPYALVLVPTRELALQSFDTVQKLLKPFMWIVPGVLMGGEKRKSEKARLRKGINILISTPGRLVDHIKSTKNIHFSRLRWLVFDEADRILDLGFEKDITVILNAVNAECQKRQNVLLSATLTEGVTRLADISLHDPVSISVLDKSHDQLNPKDKAVQEVCPPPAGDELDSFAIPESLQQHVAVVPSKLRLVCLAAFILQKCKFEKDQKMVVFFSSCELVEFHYSLFLQTLLSSSGAPASGQLPSASTRLKFLRLHGSMEQEERTAVFQEFSRSRRGVLLCTDVAARGLDLPQVTWIVQYSAPSSPAEYIHRIGRTARIGCHGSSLLILAPSEAEYVNSLASHKINVSEIKMEDILCVLTRDDCFKGKRWGAQKSHAVGPQEIRERATVLQTVFEDYVHSSERRVSWAKKALQSFIQAYATYPRELKHIFHVRSLHLGHVAKSFGLRDAPRNLSALTRRKRKAHLKRGFQRERVASIQNILQLLDVSG
ncbi:probable ATP-dependent RNA helicase DDX31 isoform X2 [Hylobates moloch]|uniref:probable ATP-dependent RNA helicase DDX31 isoform X2 n=1 Tax=Hylobates moloch TaxID=81572 RepID=UPI0026764270|nr:probable ATP-dependent RNA helicase DDX31 isoform X2 [Hylobates moloch]